jgi:pimeloyl-CoA dehydrogenase
MGALLKSKRISSLALPSPSLKTTMNFEISDELKSARDSLARVLADHFSPQHRHALAADSTSYAEQAWKEIAGLGLTGLQVPEAFDGLGGNFTDLLPLLYELGHSLAPVPFLSTCVLGAVALRMAGNPEVQRTLLPTLAAGNLEVACPHTLTPDSVPGDVSVHTHNDHWLLNGAQKQLPYAVSADWLILVAKTDSTKGSQQGLFLVARHAQGVHFRAFRLIDGTPAADVRFENTHATALCAPGSSEVRASIDAMAAAGIAATCAQMVGAMEAALQLTVEYLKTRRQFGRPIGENQALRHRTAEMLVSLETARSLAIAAAVAAGTGGFGQAHTRADLRRAKFLVGRNGRTLCQTAIQLHGGIGMTEEYAVGHYLRRIHVLDQQFGNGAAHLRQLTQQG